MANSSAKAHKDGISPYGSGAPACRKSVPKLREAAYNNSAELLRGMPRKVSDQQLMEAHGKKLSLRQAAQELHVYHSAVHQRWKKMGLKSNFKNSVEMHELLLEKHDEELKRWHSMKLSSNAVAEKLHVSKGCVQGLWRSIGLEPSTTKQNGSNGYDRILLKRLSSSDWETRSAALRDPKASENILMKGLDDPDPKVRKSAAENVNATERVLEKAMLDGYFLTRILAISNRNAGSQVIRMGLHDDDKSVRRLAEQRAVDKST